MGLCSWPLPSQTDLIVTVTTDGLAGVYDATVRLGHAELFDDGWQPMLEPAAMRRLLTDLARLGDEQAQVARLGWTLRRADDGGFELIEANLPSEQLEQVDGRFRLPRECRFAVVGELPPLAQLYRSLTLLEAFAYGPSDQLVEPRELLAQARTAGCALGDVLGALLGLAVNSDAPTVHAALSQLLRRIDGPDGEPVAAGTPPAAAPGPDPVDAEVTAAVHAIHRELVAAAADTVTAYLPGAAR